MSHLFVVFRVLLNTSKGDLRSFSINIKVLIYILHVLINILISH